MGQKITPQIELRIAELGESCDEIMAYFLSLRVANAPKTMTWENDALSGIAAKMSDFLGADPEEKDQRLKAFQYLIEDKIVDREWNLIGSYAPFYRKSFNMHFDDFLREHKGVKSPAGPEVPDFDPLDVQSRRGDDPHFTF